MNSISIIFKKSEKFICSCINFSNNFSYINYVKYEIE